jgi:cell division septal protein FtsQ
VAIQLPRLPVSSFAKVWTKPRVAGMAILLLLVAGLVEVFSADLFYVHAFEVSGLRVLNQTEVVQATGLQDYSVFFIDPRFAEEKLRQMPQIRQARVSLVLPDRVVIEVEEREPAAVWQQDRLVFWIDREGLAFPARQNRPELPTIHALDAVSLADSAVRKSALDAVAILKGLKPGLKNFDWSTTNGISITDEHGWRVHFGQAPAMADKFAMYQQIADTALAQHRTLALIDLSSGLPYFQEAAR